MFLFENEKYKIYTYIRWNLCKVCSGYSFVVNHLQPKKKKKKKKKEDFSLY